ncbi:MAG: hypothetical protein ACREXU_10930, partial [Gammaproteobacteria bacterium]
TPSGRTTLEATYGRRFFGGRYFFNLSHESRRTRWHITYDEVPYTARQAQIDEATAAQGGAIPVIDPVTGLPTGTGAGIPTLSDEVYVQRRLSGGVVLEAGRNDFDILVFQEQRDFQSGGFQSNELGDDFWGASILWTRNLSRLTYLDMSVGWTSADTISDSTDARRRQDDLLGLHVGLRRELGRHLTSTIEYRRVERSSTDPTEDLVENRISAGIQLVF